MNRLYILEFGRFFHLASLEAAIFWSKEDLAKDCVGCGCSQYFTFPCLCLPFYPAIHLADHGPYTCIEIPCAHHICFCHDLIFSVQVEGLSSASYKNQKASHQNSSGVLVGVYLSPWRIDLQHFCQSSRTLLLTNLAGTPLHFARPLDDFFSNTQLQHSNHEDHSALFWGWRKIEVWAVWALENAYNTGKITLKITASRSRLVTFKTFTQIHSFLTIVEKSPGVPKDTGYLMSCHSGNQFRIIWPFKLNFPHI